MGEPAGLRWVVDPVKFQAERDELIAELKEIITSPEKLEAGVLRGRVLSAIFYIDMMEERVRELEHSNG